MRYLMLTVAALVTTALVACGKKNNSVANPDVFVGGCNAGYYISNGSCVVVPGGSGFHYGLSTSRAGGSLHAVNSQVFAQLLAQYGRFCAVNGWNNWPGQLNYNITFGSANCHSYSQAGYVKIYFDSTGTRAQVILGAGANTGFSAHELVFNSRVYPINNYQGLEIRGYGQAYSGSWNAVYDQGLVITVQNGNLNSTNFTAQLLYRGQSLGEAHIYRH